MLDALVTERISTPSVRIIDASEDSRCEFPEALKATLRSPKMERMAKLKIAMAMTISIRVKLDVEDRRKAGWVVPETRKGLGLDWI